MSEKCKRCGYPGKLNSMGTCTQSFKCEYAASLQAKLAEAERKIANINGLIDTPPPPVPRVMHWKDAWRLGWNEAKCGMVDAMAVEEHTLVATTEADVSRHDPAQCAFFVVKHGTAKPAKEGGR